MNKYCSFTRIQYHFFKIEILKVDIWQWNVHIGHVGRLIDFFIISMDILIQMRILLSNFEHVGVFWGYVYILDLFIGFAKDFVCNVM